MAIETRYIPATTYKGSRIACILTEDGKPYKSGQSFGIEDSKPWRIVRSYDDGPLDGDTAALGEALRAHGRVAREMLTLAMRDKFYRTVADPVLLATGTAHGYRFTVADGYLAP